MLQINLRHFPNTGVEEEGGGCGWRGKDLLPGVLRRPWIEC